MKPPDNPPTDSIRAGSMPAPPDCAHRPPCPGCPAFGAPLSDAESLGPLRALAAEAGIALELLPGPQFGYRHRARLAVRGRALSPKVGIFQAGSHRIADIPRCVVHHPSINRVAAGVRQAIKASGAAPYIDGPHRGLVRYLQVMVDPGSGRCQLVVVCNADDPGSARPLLGAVQDALGDLLHSLFWNGQPQRSNAIVGPHWAHISGPPVMQLRIGGADVAFPPDAFAQNNLPLYTQLVDWVHARVAPGVRLAELYAGVGAIGLGLVASAASVAFNEVGEGSLRGLRLGLDALGPELAGRVQVHAGEAGKSLDVLAGAEVVVVDPPRRGLEAALLEALSQRPVGRLLYVSCGLASFERDARALLSAGYRLRELVAADLFPFTGHVETLAHFDHPAA